MTKCPTVLMIPLLLLLMTSYLGAQEEAEPLPRGFGRIELGLPLEDARDSVEGNSNFSYRGAPDVSFRPSDQERLIESEGRGFMERGAFQFYEGRLYIITLFLSRERMDYFTLYRTLTEKYGEPEELSPQNATWRNEETIMILERPVTVKYIDRAPFEERVQEGEAEESLRAQSRDAFLEQF